MKLGVKAESLGMVQGPVMSAQWVDFIIKDKDDIIVRSCGTGKVHVIKKTDVMSVEICEDFKVSVK